MANYDTSDVEQALYHTALLNQQNPTLDAITRIADSMLKQYELERKLGKAAVPEKSFGVEAPNIIERLLSGNRPVESRSATDVGGSLDTGMWQPSVSGGTAVPGSFQTEFFSPAQPATLGTEMAKTVLPAVDLNQPGGDTTIANLLTGQASPLDVAGVLNKKIQLSGVSKQMLSQASGVPVDNIPDEMSDAELKRIVGLKSISDIEKLKAQIELQNALAGKAGVETGIKDIELQQKKLYADMLKLFAPQIEKMISDMVSKTTVGKGGGLTAEEAKRKKELEAKIKK